jgi:antitoxin component HigA of HigAB toxin-antitoxin module
MRHQAQFAKYKASDNACFLIRKEWERYKRGNIRVRTLSDLGYLLGTSKNMMTQYFNGHKKMSLEMVLKLASIFGCTPYDLDNDFPTWIEGTFYIPDAD